MNNNSTRKLTLSFMALLVMLACELPVLSTPASSNPESVSIETIIAGTGAAAQTQTSLVQPSATQTFTDTPRPTLPPSETPTPSSTSTVIFIIPTSTVPTSTKQFEPHSAGSDCDWVDLVPFKPTLNPGSSFDVQWTIKNTSSKAWGESDIDFKHTQGTDMHKKDIYDLPQSVSPNSSIKLSVAMVAPNNSGTYTTTWSLKKSNKTLCTVTATVIVK